MICRIAWSICLLSGCLVTALWPLPVQFVNGSKALWLDPDFVSICKEQVPDIPKWSLRERIQKYMSSVEIERSYIDRICDDTRVHLAISRTKRELRNHAFQPWKFHPKDHDFEAVVKTDSPMIRLLELQETPLNCSDASEAYEIIIQENGQALIRFQHVLGALAAFSTFLQLFHRHSRGGIYLDVAPLHIKDWPAYEHRGLNLDIARNIISPIDVKRTLDGMAMTKLNRLHIHASDAQSWPIEVPSLPELATQGAYHSSQVWTVSDLHQVQKYGCERGVEVYIELDMPGHTASVHEAYPDLISSYDRRPWSTYSAQPPSGQLKLEDHAVRIFARQLLEDVLPRVKDFSSTFHLGGDEINAKAYNMTFEELQHSLQEFVDYAISILHDHDMIPVVWEELILDHNLTLPIETIVQAWRSSSSQTPSSVLRILQRGYRATFGANDHWYLDCGHGSWTDPAGPDSAIKKPFLDYCGPYHNWRDVYVYDPIADVPTNLRHLIVGGEVSMWAEQTDGLNLDSNLWPRLAAAAENLWRGNITLTEDVTRRLAEMREWLVAQDIACGPVQILWCLMNKGACVQ